MKKLINKRNNIATIFLSFFFWQYALPAQSNPEQDQAQFRSYYQDKFPQLKLADYRNGVYAIDPIAKQSWLAIEEFPPYEPAVDAGKKLFETPFSNGKCYADCFVNLGAGVSNTYPRWDKRKGEVVTLAQALNACRKVNKETPLPYDKPQIVYLQAYLAFISRGKAVKVNVPKNDPRAVAAYEQGKAFYYQRHGQLNFACATCHIQNVGKKLRAEMLSPSLGNTANWPVYRLKWGEIGSLHRRFAECLTNIKAESYPEQSPEFRNLEFFLTYMSNGVPISGPSVRK